MRTVGQGKGDSTGMGGELLTSAHTPSGLTRVR